MLIKVLGNTIIKTIIIELILIDLLNEFSRDTFKMRNIIKVTTIAKPTLGVKSIRSAIIPVNGKKVFANGRIAIK